MNVRALAVVVAAAVLPFGPAPARAASADAVVLSGTAAYAPPIGLLPEVHDVALSASATVTGTNGVAVTYPCQFAGTTIESTAGGDGVFAGFCGPWAVPYCFYARAGAHFTLVCNGALVDEGVFVGEWAPSGVLPTASASVAALGEVVF